jgi:tetratricopeptide (TPR) repeat protein
MRTASRLARVGLAVLASITLGLAVQPSTSAQAPPVAAGVLVREETVVIPTYRTGEPLKAPMFFDGRTYQGARGPMYPYVLVDRLSDAPVDTSYRVVWLENEFVKVGILPDLGGRIWVGRDKTNGYDFFYRNTVIKPALIGMVGAWISGGVEWNIPHHHRASTFMPVQYRVEEAADGSQTVWVGELELRHRMRWSVGVTLHPGRSNVDASVRLVNRTPLVHSFLYFSNVAVHANKDYQVIFPPSTQFGTQHAKSEFTTWPIGSGKYAGTDFTDVDVSWWKNHPSPISIFAWNDSDDFLAGYDHGKHAGTLHVADHRSVPGKKFFEWGPGKEGAFWDSILTDKDGPYLELMVGGYSDNQPDYSWIQPGETKIVEQSWYPIRELGGVMQATRDAALNLRPAAAGAVQLALNASAVYPDATVRLTAGDKTLFEKKVTIGPAAPFSEAITVPAGTRNLDLRASLVTSDGRELVSYQPRELEKKPMPTPVVPPPPPSQVKTSEELYLAGQRLEQFYSPAADPQPYYEEALKRDPGDARAHTALGVRMLRRGLHEDAAKHLEQAVARVARNYTSPRDADAYYYLGVARVAVGDDVAADKAFSKAAWDRGWKSAASTRLAEIAARRKDWNAVLTRASEAIDADQLNTRAHVIKAVALLRLGRAADAVAASDAALAIDPLDHWAPAVRLGARVAVAAAGGGVAGTVISSGAPTEALLETAADFESLGLLDDALSLLQSEPSAPPGQSEDAMVQYVMADYAERLGRKEEAARYAAAARAASTDYVFPFRLEHIGVLRRAMERDPNDARAPYYLGNPLMDIQPEAAVEAWKKSAALDPSFAMVHRNLGWAAARRENGLDEAIQEYEKAIAADPNEPVFYYELDRLYERANVDPAKRYALLDAHRATLALRDDATARLATLGVRTGKYDDALQLLGGRTFHTWEGARFLVHDDYVDALLLRGRAKLAQKRPKEALADFRSALLYPPNLGVGAPSHDDRLAEVRFHEGQALAALKRTKEAEAAWHEAVKDYEERFGGSSPGLDDWTVAHYYHARSFEALGHKDWADLIYDGLRQAGDARLAQAGRVDFFAKFGERESAGRRKADALYLRALGELGLGKAADAKSSLEDALRGDVSHTWAAAELDGMSRPGVRE